MIEESGLQVVENATIEVKQLQGDIEMIIQQQAEKRLNIQENSIQGKLTTLSDKINMYIKPKEIIQEGGIIMKKMFNINH